MSPRSLGRMVLLERGLMAVAVAALGYCIYVAGDSWVVQHRAESLLERQKAVSQPVVSPVPEDTNADGLIGRIDIPRVGISVPVMEGAGEGVLRHSAGHIAGTTLPGRPGNVGIAAHRDTFFRPLRNVRNNDMITLTTVDREYRYRVISTRIVSPYDVSVLEPDGAGGEVLTLVTCYPFYYVGSAPNRFIVRAEKMPDLIAAAKPSPFR